MARKFDLISELYERTCKTVVSNPQNWQSFLLSACRNYKLRFDEQILVYAQRPNATAVLEIERWNKSFGRWVNRGAKGIAVFEDANRNTQRLMHYFDISDTHEGERALPVPIWSMDESYEADIIETLESTFGTLENKDNLAEAIISSAKNATEDNIADYLSDLIALKEDSFLEDLDEDAITVAYRQLITNSVAFMIMSRLNMDTELFFDDDDFRDVTDFNTQDTLNALGYATSDIAEMGLAEIAKTVVSLDKRNRTIAENNKSEYNEVEIKSERSSDYERSNIHNDRRLQSSEPDNANSATGELRQIRTAQEEVFERTSQSSVLQLPDEMQTDRTSGRSGTESLADGRNSDETDVSSGGLDRRTESTGYDDLGSQNEQSEEQSSGNRESGSDIQLEYFDRKNEDRSIDFLHRDSDIKAILLTTPHLKASKSEIVDYYETIRDRSKQTEYIKSIFNNDRTEFTVPDGRRMGYKTYQNVLHMWEGSYDNKTKQSYYDWRVIAGYFEGMRLLKELTDTMKPLPSMEGQLNFLNEAGEQKTPVFSFSQEIIDAVLTRGSGVSEGKLRIYEQFQKSLSKKENVTFLKNEYGWGGSYPIITGTGIDEMHDGKGIRLSKGLGTDAPKIVLSWPQVEKRLSELMKLDRYLNPKEQAYYPQWLEEQERKRADIAAERQLKEFLSRQPEEPKEYEYKYHLGDKVYIGASEYEITSFDDNRVTLFDSKFPLFGTEMPREEFDTKVKENPMNDHLKVVVEKGVDKTEVVKSEDTENKSIVEQYRKFKVENADKILLFQVGDFFEVMDDDAVKVAEALSLTLTSRSNGDERLPMCGFSNKLLETYTDMLLDRGYDVAIATDDKVLNFESDRKHNTIDSYPVGRIDYYDANGDITNSIEYLSPAKIRSDLINDSPFETMGLVLYKDSTGKVIPHSFVDNLPKPLKSFEILEFETKEYEQENAQEETDDSDLIGKKLTLDDRNFEVERVSKLGDVSLRDLTFEKENGYLLSRVEKIEFVLNELESQQKKQTLTPTWEKPKQNKTTSFDLHPDIPYAQRHNFDLKSNEIETVGKKERFRRNMDAIRVLKECEFDNRFATPDEQIILSKYVGWGGIPEAFDENNSAWENEFKELYVALSPDEYAQARESTLTAFYTPPTVIKAIYKAMEQVGFKEGNLLEPSCGIGHFIGMLPDSMKDSKIYGVELDTVSAKIAQQLYQTSSIAAQGYEETNLPDSFFDGVIGNVPFGDFKVIDKRYDKHKFLIHDYFFAKSLDKLRPGGVMALVTSKGTMDKENSSVRKYIAQRAELLGAIRLPNNTFKGNAGTEVVSDILFLQKRDRLIDIEPDWVHLDTDKNGIKMNSYFIEHPEMILGEMKMVSGRFGMEATCEPYENANLEDELMEAVSNIHGEITAYEVEEELSEEDNSIPADPTVRNFSYTLVDDVIYFRENSKMTPVEVSATAQNRIKGMIAIRDSVRNLIDLQTDDFPDEMIKQEQTKLNNLYDTYTKKYGLINSRANISAFSQDSSFSLLSALEILNEDGQLERKADMFFKRTIKPHTPVTTVDTSSEALAVSIGEKATIDMEYMMSLTGKSEAEIFNDLKGVIFMNPLYDFGNHSQPKYLMADEYLSGNVREKLKVAINSAELYPDDYKINVEALTKVQPKDLTASEISVRLGATWLPPEIVERFMYEFLDTPRYAQWKIKVHFSPYTSEWNIENKSYDNTNVKAYSTYGTNRINAYKIIEETLNLKDVRIFDYVEDEFGKRKAVLNKKETAIAQAKQELIKQGFQDWIWADPQRREKLTKLYNEKFNSIRPREYDGNHINFSGMNPEIELREHQRNAVAHILYGGNTLLAHAVGAGKSATRS